MAKYACLFILLVYIHVVVYTNGSGNTKYRRSLHFAHHLRDELSSARTFAINIENDLKEKDIPGFLRNVAGKSRHKRAASASNQLEPNRTFVSMPLLLLKAS